MRWWGKGVGATFGWAAGGPWGALIGVLLGNSADSAAPGERLWRTWGVPASPAGWYPAFFAVLGYVARADGRVSAADVSFAQGLIFRLRLNAAQRTRAIRAYNLGRARNFRPEPSLMRLRAAATREPSIPETLFAVLVAGACADGFPPGHVMALLERIGTLLGLDRDSVATRLAEHGLRREAVSLVRAYELLGIDADSSDRDVKAAYRRMMHRHHPDRLGDSAGPELWRAASRRAAEIRRAWDTIRARRGIR